MRRRVLARETSADELVTMAHGELATAEQQAMLSLHRQASKQSVTIEDDPADALVNLYGSLVSAKQLRGARRGAARW